MRIEHKDAKDISDLSIWLCGKANFGLNKIKVLIPKTSKISKLFFKNRSNKRFKTRKKYTYRNSAYSFRGNYSFLKVENMEIFI